MILWFLSHEDNTATIWKSDSILKGFRLVSLSSHLNVLTFFTPVWGMLRRIGCVKLFFFFYFLT